MHLSHHNAKNCRQYLLRDYAWISNIKKERFSYSEQTKILLKVWNTFIREKRIDRDNKEEQLQHI